MGPAVRELSESKTVSPGVKLILELGPIVLFVLTYNFGGRFVHRLGLPETLEQPIFLATAVLMLATPIAIAISWVLTRSLPAMPIVTLVIVTIFGALTLYFQNDLFIKLKPTILNTLFGLALLGGLVFGKSLLRIVMDTALQLDEEGWRKLTFRWGLFFLFLALVNEIVWRNFSESFWVGFKFWGMTSLTMLFVLSQTPLIMRHTEESESPSA